MKWRSPRLVLAITLIVFGLCAGVVQARPAAAPRAAGTLAALEEARMKASNGAPEDHFGEAVAISGTTAVVGAPWKTVGGVTTAGAAYVFTRSASGWTQRAVLTVPLADRSKLDRYGTSVAISGTTLLVGCYFKTYGGMEGAGAVYVYTGSGASWKLQTTLHAGTPGAHHQFGWSVALSGDTALVGDLYQTVDGTTSAGSAYVFTRSGTSWSQQQMLSAPDAAVSDRFGVSVALDGDTALVGADKKTVGGLAFAGSVYVFTRSGSTWTPQTQLPAPSDAAANRHFGDVVALAGDTALVGRFYGREQSLGGTEAGAAYVFVGSGATWAEQAKLVPDDSTVGDLFGAAVTIDGDRAVVGARARVNGSMQSAGATYVFDRSSATWSQVATLLSSDQNSMDSFGTAVALSGRRLLVGAPGKSFPGKVFAGGAYVKLLGAVIPAVSLKASPTTLKVGKSVMFSGVVTHPIAGYRSVVLKRKVGGKWVTLKTLTSSVSGAYKWTMRTTKVAKLVVEASYRVGASRSASRLVTVNVHR